MKSMSEIERNRQRPSDELIVNQDLDSRTGLEK